MPYVESNPPDTLLLLREVALPISTPEDLARTLNPELEEIEQDPTHYAWFRLPRFMHQRQTTFDETEGAAVSLDLCSAVPLYAELVSSLNYRVCELTAKDVVAQASVNLSQDPGVVTLGSGHELARPELWQRVMKNPNLTDIVKSMVTEMHYRLPLDFNAKAHTGQLALWFNSELRSRTLITKHWDSDDGDTEGRWNIDYVNTDVSTSALEAVANTAIPSIAALEARAELRRRSLVKKGEIIIDYAGMKWDDILRSLEPGVPDKELHLQAAETTLLGEILDPSTIIDDLSEVLAQCATSHHWWRPLDVYSVDSANTTDLVESATKSFDIETRSLQLFERGVRRINSSSHLTVDVLKESLNFAPESIALITCFEGIPFYEDIPRYGTDEYHELLDTYCSFFDRLYATLKPGGRIVIFPWATRKHDIDDTLFLSDIVKYLTNSDPFPEISTNSYNIKQLKEWMGDTDKNVMLWSPLFKDTEGEPISEDGSLDALVVIKPNSKMRFRHGDRGR